MSYLPARIVGPVVLGTSATDLFAVTRAIRVEEILIANTTGSPITATVSVNPGSGLITGAFLPGATVAAHDVLVEDTSQVLNVGDKLNGFASVNPGVVIMVSGLLL